MWRYDPPLRDMRFVIDHVLQAPAWWAGTTMHADLDAETSAQVLEEAGRFAAEVLAPINGPGDLQGCRWSDGTVQTPDGYPAAYQSFVEGGWPALACDPDCGGQGLPNVLNAALYEMLAASNHAWTMYPGLLHGAYECLHAHASGELRDWALPKVTSGEWLATMCLTEAHAGSDLGLLRTRAVPLDDGRYAVTGTKIFISGGEHDLTENIMHLVLARLPDAPPGTKGLSLLLVPKFMPDGTRNTLRCDGIEKKMGIKGSATCIMSFEGAAGWLLGQPHRGLPAMFLMMNAARLHVGLQGLGHLEAATQNALSYTAERLQSRSPERPADAAPSSGADPIAYHPIVRRKLLTLQARTEAARVLAYWAAQALDEQQADGDEAVRASAGDRATLLTPVVKALLTRLGHEGADEALGLWGGHGYVHDYGIEQTVRDSRIAMIYEGTNEIQANDLLLRKVLPDGGEKLMQLLSWVSQQAGGSSLSALVHAQIDDLRGFVEALKGATSEDGAWAHRAAEDFLHAFGELLLSAAWARCDAVASRMLSMEDARVDTGWLQHKRTLARFHADYLAHEMDHHLAAARAARAALPYADQAA